LQDLKQKTQTWTWSEILLAAGETDAALRRKLQRRQVKLDASPDGGPTQANLWDIARLRVSRHLCDLNFDAQRSFGLAELFVDLAYKNLMTGRQAFSADAGERQEFKYLVSLRANPIPGGVRIVTVLPDDPQRGLMELALAASDPQNVILPVHAFVLDAWHTLPNLPLDVAAWMNASRKKMHALQSRGDKRSI
jgi:hypothetical protein